MSPYLKFKKFYINCFVKCQIFFITTNLKKKNNFYSIEIENAIESFPDFGYCNKINEECLKNYLTFDILMLFIEKLFEVDNLNCAACLMRNGQLHDCLPNYKQANPRFFIF
jgi:hypothetical protein